jgi:hypothetical protein
MNAFIMMRERLLLRSSPDKGRGGQEGFAVTKLAFSLIFRPNPPPPPSIPLSGGKWANKRFPTPYGGVMQWPREPNGIHAIALLGVFACRCDDETGCRMQKNHEEPVYRVKITANRFSLVHFRQ